MFNFIFNVCTLHNRRYPNDGNAYNIEDYQILSPTQGFKLNNQYTKFFSHHFRKDL